MVLHLVPYDGDVSTEDRAGDADQPPGIRFADLMKVCEHYFGAPRHHGTAHAVFKTPWPGDPRVNIQNDKGSAKAYQVRQVLAAIDKVEGM